MIDAMKSIVTEKFGQAMAFKQQFQQQGLGVAGAGLNLLAARQQAAAQPSGANFRSESFLSGLDYSRRIQSAALDQQSKKAVDETAKNTREALGLFRQMIGAIKETGRDSVAVLAR
jgi:hypothetical protein